MTSGTLRTLAGLGLLSLPAMATLGGCAHRAPVERLTAPSVNLSPYDTSFSEVLWAVAPLANESGSTLPDMLLLTDHLIAAAEETRGVRAIPLDRTLAAMDALQMRTISSAGEARRLAQALGVDAILVGSLTAWDPYTPTMGLTLALVPRPGGLTPGASVDPRALQRQATGTGAEPTIIPDAPMSVWSARLDAKNHQVLMEVRAYAEGRTRDQSAWGWRRYTASSDLFAQFAMFQGVEGVLAEEWKRVARADASAAREAMLMRQEAEREAQALLAAQAAETARALRAMQTEPAGDASGPGTGPGTGPVAGPEAGSNAQGTPNP